MPGMPATGLPSSFCQSSTGAGRPYAEQESRAPRVLGKVTTAGGSVTNTGPRTAAVPGERAPSAPAPTALTTVQDRAACY